MAINDRQRVGEMVEEWCRREVRLAQDELDIWTILTECVVEMRPLIQALPEAPVARALDMWLKEFAMAFTVEEATRTLEQRLVQWDENEGAPLRDLISRTRLRSRAQNKGKSYNPEHGD